MALFNRDCRCVSDLKRPQSKSGSTSLEMLPQKKPETPALPTRRNCCWSRRLLYYDGCGRRRLRVGLGREGLSPGGISGGCLDGRCGSRGGRGGGLPCVTGGADCRWGCGRGGGFGDLLGGGEVIGGGFGRGQDALLLVAELVCGAAIAKGGKTCG
jgi:hypothetical protein